MHDAIGVSLSSLLPYFRGARYVLGIHSSVLDEVEGAFETFQFYKASQVEWAPSRKAQRVFVTDLCVRGMGERRFLTLES